MGIAGWSAVATIIKSKKDKEEEAKQAADEERAATMAQSEKTAATEKAAADAKAASEEKLKADRAARTAFSNAFDQKETEFKRTTLGSN